MYRLDIYSGASLLRTMYMNILVVCVGSLASSFFFNFCLVAGVVSAKVNFTFHLCREFKLFLRTSLHSSHTTDA